MSASTAAINDAIFDLTQWDAPAHSEPQHLDKLVAHPSDSCEKLVLNYFFMHRSEFFDPVTSPICVLTNNISISQFVYGVPIVNDHPRFRVRLNSICFGPSWISHWVLGSFRFSHNNYMLYMTSLESIGLLFLNEYTDRPIFQLKFHNFQVNTYKKYKKENFFH